MLKKLAEKAHLKEKVEHMFDGTHLNVTEDRSVLHVALRAPRDYVSPLLPGSDQKSHGWGRSYCTVLYWCGC